MTNFKPDMFTKDNPVSSDILIPDTENEDTLQPINRTYKSSLFEQIFNSKSEALSLYNAINGTNYTDEKALSITTLKGALFMGYKNDVSFLLDSILNLYEHQSTWNPNMPVRGLTYFAKLYDNYITQNGLDIYSSTRLKLPKAQYYVFYNGLTDEPDRQILRLSDSYPDDQLDIHLEVQAVMLNINYGHNRELMEKCRTLHDYALFISRVREYIEAGYQTSKAVEIAVDTCIRDNILKDFLIRNKIGVKTMLFDEYYWERHKKIMEEEARNAGHAAGHAAGIAEGRAKGHAEGRAEGHAEGCTEGLLTALLILLSNFGDIPENIQNKIQSEKDAETLKSWLHLASKAPDIDSFIKGM